MKNNFDIELNHPEYILPKGKGHNLKTIFSVCFEFPTDDLHIIWNGILIECSYAYEVPYLIYPLFEVIKHICASEEGEFEESIGMDSLHTRWKLNWDKHKLSIRSHWGIACGVEDELNQKSVLNIGVKSFLNSCYKLVELILNILHESKITISDRYYNNKFLHELSRSYEKRLAGLKA